MYLVKIYNKNHCVFHGHRMRSLYPNTIFINTWTRGEEGGVHLVAIYSVCLWMSFFIFNDAFASEQVILPHTVICVHWYQTGWSVSSLSCRIFNKKNNIFLFIQFFTLAQFPLNEFHPGEAGCVSGSCLFQNFLFALWSFNFGGMHWWAVCVHTVICLAWLSDLTELCLFLMKSCLMTWKSQQFNVGFSALSHVYRDILKS